MMKLRKVTDNIARDSPEEKTYIKKFWDLPGEGTGVIEDAGAGTGEGTTI